MSEGNVVWAEEGVFVSGKHDTEVVYFHRNLDGKNNVVLAGKITVDHVAMETTIEYSPRYLALENAVALESGNYPLRDEPYVNKFEPDSSFQGIPLDFCVNNIDGYRGKLARNSFVDEPDNAPNTPAQLLCYLITAVGVWYFSPTRQLVRAIRQEAQFDSLDDLDDDNGTRVEGRL